MCWALVCAGNYVANRVTDKITSLAENIYICRSGSASDTQMISSYVTYFLHQHRIEYDDLPEVKTAANLAMQMAYGNKVRTHVSVPTTKPVGEISLWCFLR
eukprot:6759117-Pyramimonas_sp.AAC.1